MSSLKSSSILITLKKKINHPREASRSYVSISAKENYLSSKPEPSAQQTYKETRCAKYAGRVWVRAFSGMWLLLPWRVYQDACGGSDGGGSLHNQLSDQGVLLSASPLLTQNYPDWSRSGKALPSQFQTLLSEECEPVAQMPYAWVLSVRLQGITRLMHLTILLWILSQRVLIEVSEQMPRSNELWRSEEDENGTEQRRQGRRLLKNSRFIRCPNYEAMIHLYSVSDLKTVGMRLDGVLVWLQVLLHLSQGVKQHNHEEWVY